MSGLPPTNKGMFQKAILHSSGSISSILLRLKLATQSNRAFSMP